MGVAGGRGILLQQPYAAPINRLVPDFLTNTSSVPSSPWSTVSNGPIWIFNQVTHELSGREQSEVEAHRVVTTSVDDCLRGEPRHAPRGRFVAKATV